jgi:hypothetical protein
MDWFQWAFLAENYNRWRQLVKMLDGAQQSAIESGKGASRSEAANSRRTRFLAIVFEHFQEDVNPILAIGFQMLEVWKTMNWRVNCHVQQCQ